MIIPVILMGLLTLKDQPEAELQKFKVRVPCDLVAQLRRALQGVAGAKKVASELI